jgi:predicted metal-binding protein
VEIWTDEIKTRCPACRAVIYNRETPENAERMAQAKADQDKPWTVEVIEYQSDTGASFFYEQYTGPIAMADIVQEDALRDGCEGCRRHGMTLACPPYSPEYGQLTAQAQHAQVICIRFPTSHFEGSAPQDRYRAASLEARHVLKGLLLDHRQKGAEVAGSGGCHICDECVVHQGQTECILPEEMTYGLSALGVNVGCLVKTCFDMDLEWSNNDFSAEFVCAVGMAFYEE